MPEIKIGRLRGGLCVSWPDPETGQRRRYQLEARTRKEAEAEALIVYERETLRHKPRGSTVADIWAAYVDHLGERPTAKTMGYTGKAILPHFGAYRPEDIDKYLCEEYADAREEAGKSQGTIWTELGHLRSALKYGRRVRLYECDEPYVWRPAKPETDKRILNRGEISRLIDAAHAPHIRLALILLLGTAARVGALLELQWDRVNFNAGTINLRTAGVSTRKGRAIVPMNGGTRAALQTAKDAALSDFVIEWGGAEVKSIRKGVYNAIERAKIDGLTIHGLRHTAAVHMLAAGVPIEMVGQVLGHSNIQMTYRVYGRYRPQQMQTAVDVLDFTSLKNRA